MSYSDLQDDIADWLIRDDINTQIPSFIRLNETTLNRLLRVRQMEAEVELEVEEGRAALPADFLRVINLSYSGCQNLQLVTRHTKNQRVSQNQYAILGNSILVDAPVETLELSYYQSIPALSDEQESNWLLEQAYDVYLYGCLLKAAPYLGDDERINVWKGLFDEALLFLQKQNDADRLGENPLYAVPARVV